MKKTLLLFCCIGCIAGGTVASAADQGGFAPAVNATAGGFTGPGPAVTSAKEAATMRDDSHITLRGNIVQHLGKDKYLFQDASGTIRVDIDGDVWGGQTITPADTVEIAGEVDKDWNSVEIEVDRIVKVSQ